MARNFFAGRDVRLGRSLGARLGKCGIQGLLQRIHRRFFDGIVVATQGGKRSKRVFFIAAMRRGEGRCAHASEIFGRSVEVHIQRLRERGIILGGLLLSSAGCFSHSRFLRLRFAHVGKVGHREIGIAQGLSGGSASHGTGYGSGIRDGFVLFLPEHIERIHVVYTTEATIAFIEVFHLFVGLAHALLR